MQAKREKGATGVRKIRSRPSLGEQKIVQIKHKATWLAGCIGMCFVRTRREGVFRQKFRVSFLVS